MLVLLFGKFNSTVYSIERVCMGQIYFLVVQNYFIVNRFLVLVLCNGFEIVSLDWSIV